MVKNKKNLVDGSEDYDIDPHFNRVQKDQDNNLAWVGGAVIVLGALASLYSLNPKVDSGGKLSFPTGARVVDTLPRDLISSALKLSPGESRFSMELISQVWPDKLEISYLNSLRGELTTQGLIGNPDTWASAENLAWKNAQIIQDKLGAYGGTESLKMGELECANQYMVQTGDMVMIPWETCETRGDCDSDGPVCDECEDLEASGPYYPDEFPEPPHFLCRCSPGDPIILVEVDTGQKIGDRSEVLLIMLCRENDEGVGVGVL